MERSRVQSSLAAPALLDKIEALASILGLIARRISANGRRMRRPGSWQSHGRLASQNRGNQHSYPDRPREIGQCDASLRHAGISNPNSKTERSPPFPSSAEPLQGLIDKCIEDGKRSWIETTESARALRISIERQAACVRMSESRQTAKPHSHGPDTLQDTRLGRASSSSAVVSVAASGGNRAKSPVVGSAPWKHIERVCHEDGTQELPVRRIYRMRASFAALIPG